MRVLLTYLKPPSANACRFSLILILSGFLAPGLTLAQSAHLRILHINDVYEFAPKRGKGGMAQLMTLLRHERAGARNTLTTLGGDLLSPSVMSGISKGRQMIEFMNTIELDVAVPGNHEFDFGSGVLKERMAESAFTWLVSNIVEAESRPFAGAPTWMIRRVGELNVGLFSLLTEETTHLSSPDSATRFLPLNETAHSMIEKLKEQDADLIIALTHLDMTQDRDLAASVKGIDIILGGHDHDPITFFEGGTLIVKAGHDAHFLAVIDIQIDKKQTDDGVKVTITPQWRYLSTSGVEPDPKVAAIVEKHEASLDKTLNIEIGRTEVELDSKRSSVRTRETNLGNLIVDAMREAVGADVAITNSGGIRGDRIYPSGSVLTRRDILTELPFSNVTVKLEMVGAKIIQALENSVSRVADKAGRFPHVSGMAFVYDPAAPAGKRILSATVGTEVLHPEKVYSVATNDYIAGGGDGYAVFKDARRLINASGAVLMATQVIDYISARGDIAPAVEGRIRQP